MDDLSTMLTQYESMGNEYRLRSAQQLLIDGLASGKTTIIDPSKMNMLKKQKIEISLRNLASSIRENEALYDEYLQGKDRSIWNIAVNHRSRFAAIDWWQQYWCYETSLLFLHDFPGFNVLDISL